jgi:HlyD family secretion protein
MSKGKLTVLIGLILLLIGSFWLYSSGKKNRDSKYKVQNLEKGDINATVTAAGSLSALKTVQVGSQVSGIISQLYVDFNSHVKKGQLIAELDPITFQAVVDQRRADLEKAKVEVRNMQTVFQRDKKLYENQLLSSSEYDTGEANLQGAQATVAQAQAALKQAETNLSYTKILSPIDGIVVDRQYDIGQTVAASFQAPTLFTIAQDLTRMQVSTSIDEADVGKISPGQVATFIVDAYPEQVFHGKVSQIRLSTQIVQNVVTYTVLIDVQNNDLKLKPGMTANVTIPYETKSNVLKIPNAALRFQPEPGDVETKPGRPEGKGEKRGAKVYVLTENQRLQPVFVRTSLTDGVYTALEQGNLKEGDPIVVGLMTSKAMDSRGGMIGGGGRRTGRF